MKRFFIFLSIVVVTVAGVDMIATAGMRYYVKNYQIPGDYETIDYLIKATDDEAIILGSSVALNSAMSSVVGDSLDMTCWNGACNGQGMPYFETILDCILSHHTPRVIIFGMRPGELASGGKGGRYNILAPYYGMGYEVLDNYIEGGSWFNKVMQQSTLYRYNTIWFRIFLYNFIQPGEKGENGFIAKPIPSLFPEMMGAGEPEINNEGKAIFSRMITMCKERNIKMITFFPPTYYTYAAEKADAVKEVEEICCREGIPCYTRYNDSLFRQHPEWFYDNVHLNKDGAKVFSADLAAWIKETLKDERN